MSEPTTPNEREEFLQWLATPNARAMMQTIAGRNEISQRAAFLAQRRAEPAFYVRDSDVAVLADRRVAGRGAMLHKERGEGRTAYFAHPPRESGDAARIAELEADRDSWAKQADDRVDDALRFAAERDALLEDAERYRWLRSIDSADEWNRVGHYAADALDKIIDAAIRSAAYQGKEGGGS